MTSDMGEMFNELREARKQKRAYNRLSSAELLTERGIAFESKNMGAHLIVRHDGHVVDFWPGTGKWIVRGSNRPGRGVFKLLRLIAPQPSAGEPT